MRTLRVGTNGFGCMPGNPTTPGPDPMCMLAGGSSASNIDRAFYEQYPKGPDPDTSAPYVMWAGTACQHLMILVK